jgi:glycosyltransferase involved in cell wall biosynthesis
MNKCVLFYSSVKNKELFYIQQFYQVDITILKQLGYEVILSNRICDAWKFWKYDLLFAYFYRYSFFPAVIARFFCKEVYFTGGIDALAKSYAPKKDYIIQKFFFKLCYWISNSCIIVSKADDSNVRMIVKGKKLLYSEHTIDSSRFDCQLERKENIFITIGWQGTVSNVQRKGIDTAIQLFAKLKNLENYSDSKLYIIGKKGEGSSYLEEIVRKLNIETAVVFTDSISEEEKIEYLKRSRYYFQLSQYEGFGVAALEALCAKNIVIHSGQGGLSNPIYKDGIQLDIAQPLEDMFDELKFRLSSFDSLRLEKVYYDICRNYDNKRRKEDFARIFI